MDNEVVVRHKDLLIRDDYFKWVIRASDIVRFKHESGGVFNIYTKDGSVLRAHGNYFAIADAICSLEYFDVIELCPEEKNKYYAMSGDLNLGSEELTILRTE